MMDTKELKEKRNKLKKVVEDALMEFTKDTDVVIETIHVRYELDIYGRKMEYVTEIPIVL